MPPKFPAEFSIRQPRYLLLDVDGVLTNNSIILSASGVESKTFFVPDGLGLTWLRRSGVQVGFISGRPSEVVRWRAQELGVDWQRSGVTDKREVLLELAHLEGLALDHTVYVGDDLMDLPAMAVVGLPVAVANAHPLVQQKAIAVTQARGGEGAVREVCEWILAARGVWPDIVKGYT